MRTQAHERAVFGRGALRLQSLELADEESRLCAEPGAQLFLGQPTPQRIALVKLSQKPFNLARETFPPRRGPHERPTLYACRAIGAIEHQDFVGFDQPAKC